MGLESLLDPPEPSHFAGTKRLPDLPDVGRETKKPRTQASQFPHENAALELSKGHNSWGGFNIASSSEFGNATSQYGIDSETEWSSAVPPGICNELSSTPNPPAPEYGTFFFDSTTAQMFGENMQGGSGADKPHHRFEIEGITNTFDLDYSFDANQMFAPSLELSHDHNVWYSGNLSESRMVPDFSHSTFTEPLIDVASTWIDIKTEPGEGSGYWPLELLASSESENIESIFKSEKTLVGSLQEAKTMGNEDNPAFFSQGLDHNKDLLGLSNCSEHAPLELTRESFVLDSNQIDTCFGVVGSARHRSLRRLYAENMEIIVQTTSSWTGSQGTKVTPVTVSPFGDVMKLYFQDSKKYAGILALPVLCTLKEEFNIDYTANMVASGSRSGQRTATEKATVPNSAHECSVRIVVYGVKSEQNSVGQLLSDAGLYLQHPSAAELYRHVDYWNPHYLLRPGSQMPKLEALSICPDLNAVTTTESLDESQKGRFMQIFNSANGPSSLLNSAPSPRLKSTLKDHQVTALAMMTEKECGIVENAQFPSLWDLSSGSGSKVQYRHKVTGMRQNSPTHIYGGILADEMGLGKTLSLLALVCSSLDVLADEEGSPEDGISRATLIVTPKSTIPGWQHQVQRHIHAGRMRLAVYHGPSRHRLSSEFWKTDIVLTTYETLRLEWAAAGPLYSGTWRRVVLDEAHHIRNRLSQLFKAASAVTSKSRWCLTGTPIHNSLHDYGALLSFIGVPLLKEKSQFDFWITSPIKQKRPNSFSILGDLIRATCLRRTKDRTQESLKLPRRIERIEEIELNQADQALYDFFREMTAKIAAGLAGRDGGTSRTRGGKGANILTLMNFLRRICNNGEDLLPQSALEAWRSKNSTSVDWQMMRDYNPICDSCGSFIEEVTSMSDDGPEFRCNHLICATCSMQSETASLDDVQKCPKCAAARDTSATSSSLTKTSIRLSAKVEALLRNLHAEQTPKQYEDKALPIKSHWTKMLDLIATALLKHGFRFQRIDGQSSLLQRSEAIQLFNEDPACTVMLASIGSAGEGVDLTIANHVHVVEPHWSPMAEAQAVDRVHRIGQTREVTITRYIVHNTIETYIQWVQQDKLRLINRSLDAAEILQEHIDDARWKMLQKVLDASNQ